MQNSSCSVEYSISGASKSAERTRSLSITVPPSSAANARLKVLLPVPGRPAIRISMDREYRRHRRAHHEGHEVSRSETRATTFVELRVLCGFKAVSSESTGRRVCRFSLRQAKFSVH